MIKINFFIFFVFMDYLHLIVRQISPQSMGVKKKDDEPRRNNPTRRRNLTQQSFDQKTTLFELILFVYNTIDVCIAYLYPAYRKPSISERL